MSKRGKLDTIKSIFDIAKVGFEAWEIYVEKRQDTLTRDRRIKELEDEVERLKNRK